MIRIWTIGLIMGSLFLGSCSEKFEPKPFTYTQLLTGKEKKSWQLAGLEIREEGKIVGRLFPDQFLRQCVYDDLYVFYANEEKLLQVDEGFLKCDPADSQIFVESRWAFSNANATLEMIVPWLAPFPLPFVVQELSEDELSIEIWLDLENIESYRIIFTEIETE